jgi:hypothetical protein
MGRAKTASVQYAVPNLVLFSNQVLLYKGVEINTAAVCNLLAKDKFRAALLYKVEP